MRPALNSSSIFHDTSAALSVLSKQKGHVRWAPIPLRFRPLYDPRFFLQKTQWVRPVAPARPGSHQATTARSRAAAGNGPAGRTPVPDGRATTARSRAAAGNGPAGRTPVPDGSKANKQQLPRGETKPDLKHFANPCRLISSSVCAADVLGPVRRRFPKRTKYHSVIGKVAARPARLSE